MKKPIKYFLLVFVLWFLSHVAYLIYDGFRSPNEHADIAVILGNKVNEDGTLSIRLEKRMERGLELYKNRTVDRIVVSGGLGKEGHYEGDKMYEYLISKGVPDSVIIIDNYGNNTEMTVKNLLERINDKETHVIVVSQYYHITRIKQILRKNGFKHIQGASPYYFEWRDLYSIPREFVAYYLNLL